MKKFIRQFGGKLTDELKERYSTSPRWNGKAFENPEFTKIEFNLSDIPSMLHERFCTNVDREPKSKLPSIEFEAEKFMEPSPKAKMIWFGHSAVLFNIGGKIIFIDPMMGPDASPIAPFRTKRFTGDLLHILEAIPRLDAVLITHDHYDHLDMNSIDLLIPKTDRFISALGVGRHLKAWGVAHEKISELNWWDEIELNDLTITFTPSRHSSGRAVSDQSCTLWGGWVLDSGIEKIYFSGDGGYGAHFLEVGERLGPFDLGLMECGQYNEKWRVIHMHPDESVRAALDAQVNKAVPVHWGGFALAMHDWKEPVTEFLEHAGQNSLQTSTPKIGETFSVETSKTEMWWKAL